jgi:hypothetical protein
MTAAKPWTTHGIDLLEDGRCGYYAYRGDEWIGHAFPRVYGVSSADRTWYVKRPGLTARRFATRHAALAHLVGGCPGCVCVPALCESDETGASCMDCVACLHGCPEDLCDMTKENR